MPLPAIQRLHADHDNLRAALGLVDRAGERLRCADPGAPDRLAAALEDLALVAWHVHEPFEDLLIDRLQERSPETGLALNGRARRRQRLGAGLELLRTALDGFSGDAAATHRVADEVNALTRAWRDHLRDEETGLHPELDATLTAADGLVLTTRFLWAPAPAGSCGPEPDACAAGDIGLPADAAGTDRLHRGCALCAAP